MALPLEMRPMWLAPLDAEPLCSIVMSNYNYARFLGAAIESVQLQTYGNWELLICDDGSTDDSIAIACAQSAEDRRIRLLRKTNGGQASAWNVALSHAAGAIICFLDPDDMFMPEKLARVVNALQRAPRAGLCFHRLTPVDARGRVLDRPFPVRVDRGWVGPEALRRGGWSNAPPTSGLSIRREILNTLLPIPLSLRLGYCDQYVEATAQFHTEIVDVEESLTLYRRHGANASATSRPTVATIRYQLQLQACVFDAVHEFVLHRFGHAAARLMHPDCVPGHLEHVLAMHVLSETPTMWTCERRWNDVLAELPSACRRRIWSVILRLPRPLGRWSFGIWWGQPRWKRFIRPALRAAKLPPE